MDEIMGLIVIAVLWAIFSGLKKANKNKPGQPGQKSVNQQPQRPTVTRPVPRTFSPDKWPNIESLLNIGDEGEDELSQMEGMPLAQDAPQDASRGWASIPRQRPIPPEHSAPYGEGDSEYAAREIPALGDIGRRADMPDRSDRPAKPKKPPKVETVPNAPTQAVLRRRALSPGDMRSAVILSEIIAPPKSRRRRVS